MRRRRSALAVGADHTVDCTHVATAGEVAGGYHNTASVVSAEVTTPVVSNTADVAVTPLAEISGTVTEAGSGDSVGGAFVAVLRTSDLGLAAGVVADGAGAYAAEVRPGSYFVYQVDPSGRHTPGFVGAPTTVTATGGQVTEVDPVTSPTRGSVAGTVTEAGSGDPIEGAWALSLSARPANTGALEVVAASSASGGYSLDDVRVGNHFVGFVDPTGAHAPRFNPDSANVPQSTPVAVTAGTVTSTDSALPAQSVVGTGASLSGTVTESGTGDPLEGVHVAVLADSDYRLVRGAVTNAAGEWTVDVVPGTYHVEFVDSTATHDMQWFDGQPSTGLANATTVTAPGTADAALARSVGAIAGTITDAVSGAPLAGVWALVVGPQGLEGGVVTGADGTYRVDGLAPGRYFVTFADVSGGHIQEYWDGGATTADADPLQVTAAATTTADADLALPAPP